MMRKPKKPTKTVLMQKSKYLDFNYTSKEISIDYFYSWIKENVPKDAVDVTLSLDQDCEFLSYLSINWKQKINNINYDKEMIKYKKKLAKYNKENNLN